MPFNLNTCNIVRLAALTPGAEFDGHKVLILLQKAGPPPELEWEVSHNEGEWIPADYRGWVQMLETKQTVVEDPEREEGRLVEYDKVYSNLYRLDIDYAPKIRVV